MNEDLILSAISKQAGSAQRSGLKEDVSLLPHQVSAAQKTVARDGNIILAHKVGTGKTLTSIAAFEALKGETEEVKAKEHYIK